MKKTKVTTIVGTRPEIIRLAAIIKKFDLYFDHRLVHTGQNPSANLKDVFFKDLELRAPDSYFNLEPMSVGKYLGELFEKIEDEFVKNRPDCVVILGDTNSALSAILAKRLGIPVYHLEAGNRSFDMNVPEEINRKIVDHTADFNLVYTEHARNNLISEGLHPRRIGLIGSPLLEVVESCKEKIKNSQILDDLGLQTNSYFLVSLHRQENVDFQARLTDLLHGLDAVARVYGMPILVSTHPRTRKKLLEMKYEHNPLINFHEPFGFIDYNKLQTNARMVLSDSGTISEESSMLNFPAITLRDSMERPEALELGAIIMSGIKAETILEAISIRENNGIGLEIPAAYKVPDTSTRVVNFIVSTVHQYKFWNSLHTQ